MEIYLDNSATTPLSPAAKAKIDEAVECYGNPSSLHDVGLRAEKLVSAARRSILSSLGVRGGGELVFTSCGTEASSLAIFGTAFAKERREASTILTTNSEHPSVENALCRLEKHGFEVIRISTAGGVLDLDEIRDVCSKKKIFMASFMMVNNETGALYDVEQAFSIVKRTNPNAVTHCDAVQGFMKVKFTPTKIHADLVTLSAHKLHAPKGVGALYISAEMIKAKKIIPFLVGGGQERGWRSGTENVIGISAFGAAVEDISSRFDSISAHLSSLHDYAAEKLSSLDIKLNIPAKKYAPHILNITLPSIKSETMLHHLSSAGIYVSSGSACSSHSNASSPSLLAFGLDKHAADCSLRISFSEYNTYQDIDTLCTSLAEGINTLVKIRR